MKLEPHWPNNTPFHFPMKTQLIYMTPKMGTEAVLMHCFLQGQQQGHYVGKDLSYLKKTKGDPQPILVQDGEIVAKGFVALVNLWKDEGRLLVKISPCQTLSR